MRDLPLARLTSLALAALVVSAAAAADDTNIIEGKVGADLDRSVQRSTGGGFWGAVIVARGDDVLLAKGYGFADYQNTPNTPRSLLEIASTSKQFTAAGVLRLQMLGKLNVDDSIERFFGEIPDDKHAITVHHLLTHTSGVSPNVGLPYNSPASRDDLVGMVMQSSLEAKPGARFAYCNVGYALLAAIIEIASDESFETFMTREVFQPAGLIDTGFVNDDALDRSRATTRLSDRDPDATAVDWHWSWGYRGMGGVVSTAHDMATWHRVLLGDTVLDDDAKAVYYEPMLANYACGWQVGTTDRGTAVVSHGGSVEGYGCQYVRYVDEDIVIALLSNGKSDVFAVQRAIEEVLFPKALVTMSIDVTRFELDDARSVRVDVESWSVRRLDDMVGFTLLHPDDDEPMVTIDAPIGIAKRLHADLAQMLVGRADEKDEGPSMEAGVFLWNLGGDNRAISMRGLELTVMPRYAGMDEEGNQFVDERITFVVQDQKNGFWPVMTKMNVLASRKLLEALRTTFE